jgi:hypothetical protein
LRSWNGLALVTRVAAGDAFFVCYAAPSLDGKYKAGESHATSVGRASLKLIQESVDVKPLVLYFEREAPLLATSATPAAELTGTRKTSAAAAGRHYVVEQVHAFCQHGRQVDYLVKWLGYPWSEATWHDKCAMLHE